MKSWIGQFIMVHSVLQQLPVYTMPTLKDPLDVWSKLDSIHEKFFWGTKDKQWYALTTLRTMHHII